MCTYIKFGIYINYGYTCRPLRDIFISKITKYFEGVNMFAYVRPMTDKFNIKRDIQISFADKYDDNY
jgi:hypothetical protein